MYLKVNYLLRKKLSSRKEKKNENRKDDCISLQLIRLFVRELKEQSFESRVLILI